MSALKKLPNVILFIPIAALFFYPFLIEENLSGIIANYFSWPTWIGTVGWHYLQVIVLALSATVGIKIGRPGRPAKILAFLAALVILALYFTTMFTELYVYTVNLALPLTTLAAVIALGRSQSASEPGSSNDKGLREIKKLCWLLLFINFAGLILAYFLPVIWEETFTLYGLSKLLFGLFFTTAALALTAWAGQRAPLLTYLTLLASFLLIFIDGWAVVTAFHDPSIFSIYVDVESVSVIQLFILKIFCQISLVFSLFMMTSYLRSNRGAEKSGPSLYSPMMRPGKVNFARLGGTVFMAALMLGLMINWGQTPPPPAIKTLPADVEFETPYWLGQVSMRMPAQVKPKNWSFTIKDDKWPLTIREHLFTSPEEADQEYESAARMFYRWQNGTIIAADGDIRGFDGQEPVLKMSYHQDKLKGTSRSEFNLYLRMENGYIMISSDRPSDKSIPVAEHQALFLTEVRDLLEAYQWLGRNQATTEGHYPTYLGLIDAALIPISQLSGRASFNYIQNDESGRKNFTFDLSLKPPFFEFDQTRPKALPRLRFLADNPKLATIRLGMGNPRIQNLFYCFPRTTADLAGNEFWFIHKFLTEPADMSVKLQWFSNKRNPADDNSYLRLHLSGVYLNSTTADQDFILSFWDESFKHIKIDEANF